MERALLITTAVVGLIALGATLAIQSDTQQRFERMEAELDSIRINVDRAATEARQALTIAREAAIPIDDGSIDAILALQDRLAVLEQRGILPSAPGGLLTGQQQAIAAGLDGPSSDCIPLGTRFMSQVGDKFPICHTPVVIDVIAITGETAVVHNAGTLVENGTSAIEGTPCQVTLFAADLEGFAEMRVSC